ncbi:enoyl-CoA hydratase/isomerase family protein [Bacillus sp. JJ1533]|uniref:enoyl-CoA hydratase/isomerase family protein n=1 Tax=Bacillus sp. JJ1533 TaxID=3122959 RepID=UPI002FFEFD62
MDTDVTSAVNYKEYQDGKIGCLELNQPESLNAVDEIILNELEFYINQANNNNRLRVLIIKSTFLKAFSAGVNVKLLKSFSNEEASYFFEKIARILEEITKIPIVTIAAINGIAFGAGADIALSCDLRIANKKAMFRFPGPQFGVVLGTHRLVNEVGYSKARGLALLNKRLDAAESLKLGLIHEVSDDEDCFESALIIAKNLLEVPDFTINAISNICSESQDNTFGPIKVAKQSIINGDFQKRFDTYLSKIRKK